MTRPSIADIPFERVTTNPEDKADKNYWNLGYTLEHRFDENWKLRNEFRYISDRQDYGVLALPFALDEPSGILTRVFAAQFNEVDIATLYTNLQGKFKTGSVAHTLLFGVDLSRATNENATRFAPFPAFFSPLDIFNPDYTAVPKPAEADIPLAFGSNIKTDRLGIYLQDQIDILDNLIVLAGLRYDTVDQNTVPIFGAETDQTDDAITPRIGIVYQPIEPVSLYANYGFNFVGERQGDNANSFEADSYFLTSAAAFYRRDNWRVQVNVDNLFDINFIESVSNGRTRGIYPGDPLTVRASVAMEF